MPDERFIHPAEGESEKLTDLTDFEHRVWIAYKVSANDVGVMLASPAPLQTGNRNLRKRPARDIQKALETMLRAGLLLRFSQGGEQYVCSPKWQDWQRVEYPRQTHLPLPDSDTRARCSEATEKLYQKLETIRAEQSERIKNGRKKLRATSEDFQMSSEDVRPHARDRAGNANANADATGVEIRGEPERGLVLSPGQLRACVSSLVSLWNDHAVEPFVRVSDELQPQSRARVEAALKSHPDLVWWEARFADVTASAFCRGGGDRGWVADFWWVLENVELVVSGRYRDRVPAAPRTKIQAISKANQGVLERALAREVSS